MVLVYRSKFEQNNLLAILTVPDLPWAAGLDVFYSNVMILTKVVGIGHTHDLYMNR